MKECYSNIDTNDISFVVQGVLQPKIYPHISRNIRKFFPGSEIILSTYLGEDINGFDYDRVSLIEDPGYSKYSDEPGSKINNINRQIATTVAGLKLSNKQYAFKLRSDFIINGKKFISYFDDLPGYEREYKIFTHKVLSSVFFSRNPRVKKYPLPFHPSDIAFFGLRNDLLNLFDIPFMPEEESLYFKFKNTHHCRYVPEQYLWINCLRKNGRNIECDYQRHCNDKIVEETERYAVSNFIYLDYEQFNISPPKKLKLFHENDFRSVVTSDEFRLLYRHYIDTRASSF